MAHSVDGVAAKDISNSMKIEDTGHGINTRFLEEIRQKEFAKQKLIKMSAYQKSIHELYMPKQSEKKRMERE